MTISYLIRLTCLLTLFIVMPVIVMPVHGQEETTAGETKDPETDPSAMGDSPEQKETAPEQNEQQPKAENLKNRDLGAAFRSFQPSEEISADNAVPFPVDI